MNGSPFKNDLTGKTFGHLYVRKYAGKAEPDGASLWECRCYLCFKILNVRAQSLIRGSSKSCGCSNITHGLTRGPVGTEKPTEYKSWIHAKNRCFNPKCHAYKDYGGRGIVMCSGWKNDYGQFFNDMGKKPNGTSLDRYPDNDGNYSCGHCSECIERGWRRNCEWKTVKEQNRHRRSTVYLEFEGKRQSLAAWAEEKDINLKTLWRRLNDLKMPVAMALSQRA